MPRYLYECENLNCPSGGVFAEVQSMHDDALRVCPHCGSLVSRVICPVGMATPTGDSKLKDMGFAKLVRRDKGVYENMTAMDHESRYFRAGQANTMPDLKRRIRD